jgi:VWFA-related protein
VRISWLFKRCCISLALLMLMACGGGGDSAPRSTTTPNISLSQSTFDFTGIVLDNSADKIFVIQNTGNANLKMGQISGASLPFSIFTDACSNATLAPSQTCSLKVRFSPTNPGPFTASLSVPSNDPDSGTLHISVSGIGYGLNVWINQITASCPSISADVTVTDPRSSGLLNLLTQSDFKLYQNGQLQNITVTPIQYPSPVSLVLAVDASGSTANVLPVIKTAATTFISQLNAGDWAAICRFNTTIDFFPPLPGPPLFMAGDAAGKTALNSYINSIVTTGGTLLYDALYMAIDRAAQGATTKRAIIVLSDGFDESPGSVKTLDQVIAHAVDQEIPVFTIFYVDQNVGPGKTEIMLRLAKDTGGQYYNSDTASLADIFQQISNVLSNKYTLTYTPATCTGTVSVNVQADWTGLHGEDSRTLILP